MRPDIPFWSWVLARRIPIFALVTTLILVVGGTLISRHTQSYMSTADMLINPNTTQSQSVDAHTHFEFLKFRALTSGEVEQVVSDLNFQGNLMSQVNVIHDEVSGKVTIGFRAQNPELALLMTGAITRGFQSTAKTLALRDAERRAAFHASEADALRLELARTPRPIYTGEYEPERRLTEELYQSALDKLAKATADLQMPKPEILTVLRQPSLAKTPSGPDKKSMYLALISFAIFCGLVAILLLEWLDTVVRRPYDIEHTLGLATFGVIPDLQLQPIEINPKSDRGI